MKGVTRSGETKVHVRFAGLILDLDACTLSRDTGETMPLTRGEFALLRFFAKHPGRVLSRDALLEATAGRQLEPFDRSIDVMVGRLRRKIEPDPKAPRLIVTVPGDGYKFTVEVREGRTTAAPERQTKGELRPSELVAPRKKPLALPDKPSIAVLPFQNMTGDPQEDYFADGMIEDIVTGMSRIKWLFVIARNSSAIYKGRPIDVRQVGRELGVRYLLEGGVRKAGRRLRITVQLVEAETGAYLWADKFDGNLKAVFGLQDRITERVVGVVEPSVQKSEIERSRRKHPESLDAYDLYLRALPFVRSLDPESAPIAAELLSDALKLYPNFALAHAYLAWSHQIRFTRADFDEAEKAVAIRHARAAIANEVDDATALAIGAYVIGILGKDAPSALEAIERALSFNPSSAAAHFFGGFLYAWSGDPVRGTGLAKRALRLSPFDPLAYEAHLAFGVAALHLGQYGEAAAWWERCSRANPKFAAFAAAQAHALALAGRMTEAKAIFAKALELEPSLSIGTIRELGYAPEIETLWLRAARLLGVPD
jgi:TolB-like protein/Tfp pilus assembly protein PilF